MAFECRERAIVCLSEKSVNFARKQSHKPTAVCSKLEGKRGDDQDRDIVLADHIARSKGSGIGSSKGLGPKTVNSDHQGVLGYHIPSITDLPSALISEILNFLDPRELGIVSCVSTNLYKLAADHCSWKDFYCERWGLPISHHGNAGLSSDNKDKNWKHIFVEREYRSKTFLGQYTSDFLSGHTEAVRTVCILASAKLVFTSGYDCTVRVWDLEEGSSISSSRPLGCTMRAIAADRTLLVAGGTNGFIQCWNAVEGLSYLFDLKGSDTESRLWEHEGPISSLALDLSRIYSGSWDMTVRVWDRDLMECVHVLRHGDWVWSLAPRGNTVACSSGSDVYIWDTTDETLISIIPHAHVGYTHALARSHNGDFLFTGGEDGMIHMFEISNCAEDGVFKVASWCPHSGSVHSLAFEFPWLVSASSDGKLSLIDVKKLLKSSRSSSLRRHRHRSSRSVHQVASEITIEPPERMLHGSGSSLFSVDIGFDRIVCGGEECTVKVWDFSQALEKERRSRVQRGIRLENRMRQRQLQSEMSLKNGRRTDKCSVAAKKSPISGERSGTWYHKRGVSRKVKA